MNNIAETYKTVLSSQPESDLEETLGLFKKFTATPLHIEKADKVKFGSLTGVNNYQQARKFLVETLVRAELHGNLGKELLPEDSFVYIATLNKQIHGVCEIAAQKNEVFNLRHFVFSRQIETLGQAEAFLKKSLLLFFAQNKAAKLQIESNTLNDFSLRRTFESTYHPSGFVVKFGDLG